MARRSVDLDLVFPAHTLLREEILRRINEAIHQSIARLNKQGFQARLQQGLTADERRFLLSLAAGEPEWKLLEVAHLELLPSLQWTLRKIERLRGRV